MELKINLLILTQAVARGSLCGGCQTPMVQSSGPEAFLGLLFDVECMFLLVERQVTPCRSWIVLPLVHCARRALPALLVHTRYNVYTWRSWCICDTCINCQIHLRGFCPLLLRHGFDFDRVRSFLDCASRGFTVVAFHERAAF